MSILSFIKSFTDPPDPKRFANHSTPVANWSGELVGSKIKGPTMFEVIPNHFEFSDANPYGGISIPNYLTESDKEGLRRKNLNPENLNYTTAKQYFAKHPTCDDATISAASGVGLGTAKDVLAAFRRTLSIPSPTLPERG